MSLLRFEDQWQRRWQRTPRMPTDLRRTRSPRSRLNRQETWTWRYPAETLNGPHNPEVVGSNPTPCYRRRKARSVGPFFVLRLDAGPPVVDGRSALARGGFTGPKPSG